MHASAAASGDRSPPWGPRSTPPSKRRATPPPSDEAGAARLGGCSDTQSQSATRSWKVEGLDNKLCAVHRGKGLSKPASRRRRQAKGLLAPEQHDHRHETSEHFALQDSSMI